MTESTLPIFLKVRGEQNKEILRVISTVLVEHNKIQQKELDTIMNKLQQNKQHIPIQTLRRLAHVLTLLKDSYGIDTIIPAVPIPPPRASILSESSVEFSWLDGVNLMQDVFWSKWLVISSSNKDEYYESLIFAIAFSLALDVTLHSIQITNILAQLRWEDILDNGCSLKVKVHPNDRLSRYSIINLPTATRLLLHGLFKFKNKHANNDPFLFSNLDLKLNRKKEKINNILRTKYKHLFALVKNEQPNLPLPPTWTNFTRVAYIIQFDRGLEPFIITAYKQYPLPVSHPLESSLRLYGKQYNHHTSPMMLSPNSNKLTLKPSLESIKMNAQKRTINTDDWCGKSKTILRRLVIDLKRIAKKKIATNNQVQQAQHFIAIAINDADKIATNNKSALHLALCWINDYITCKRSISASTVSDYFQRAFYCGLLTFADSDDLTQWDLEDHEFAIEACLSKPNLSPSSKQSVFNALKSVYRYALQNGYAKNVNISFVADEWIGSSTRIEMIGLHRFDTFVHSMINTNDRRNIIIAVTSILAFYGGLRAGETSNLTLNDIIPLDGELYIEINSGKSAAARRRIPLHLFAPEFMCKIIEDYTMNRLDEFRKYKSHGKQPILREIPLFGAVKLRKKYTRKSLIDVTIHELKCHFGSDFVYHSLRHSFASWLLIRWYAGRYDGFLDDLKLEERDHSIFKTDAQHKLNSFFSDELEKIPDHNASDLVKFSKVIGHSGQTTMFSTYIHSFDVIQCHAMSRMSAIQGSKKLNGETIAALVYKMKDRHNHTKLPRRTINDICEYLNINT